MTYRLSTLLLITASLWAADFQSGQAARVVIGQPSFSAQEAGISPTALAISNNRLYVADTTRHLLTFDLTKIPGPKDNLPEPRGSGCAVCGFSPVASVEQGVFPGIAGVGVFGKTVAIADAAGHRVLIWRNVSLPRSGQAPDVVLGRGSKDSPANPAALIVEPISVAFDGRRLYVGDAALHRVLIWNSLPSSDNQPADEVLGQASFTVFGAHEGSGSEVIQQPTALASDGTNLFVGDAIEHRILVFTAAELPLSARNILNSASLLSGPLAPGTLVSIEANGLTDATESAPDDGSERLPKSLAGVQVFLDGSPLPLLSASQTEIRAQIPYDIDDRSASSLYVRAERSDGTVVITNAVAVALGPASPGLFGFGGTEPRTGLILHQDPSGRDEAGTPITSDSPAKPGEVVVFWSAGLGAVNDGDSEHEIVAGVPNAGPDVPVRDSVDAIVNGEPAQVLSAVLPKQGIGVYQIRVVLPSDLPPDPQTRLVILEDGVVSNAVTIPVQ